MRLKHYWTPKIAHSSYILTNGDTGAVIDPRRDVDLYIDEARALGVRLTHVLITHLHADFVSGHLELAARTGATVYIPAGGDATFAHTPLRDGDSIALGTVRVDVRQTPGHTPEHVSFVITDAERAGDPAGVATGDTLFVGDVGRPDLFPGRARALASQLYDSLHDTLLALPDYVEVYPAHGAGSLCGRTLSARWTSTIGYERRHNPALQIEGREAFIDALTNTMPPTPDHFSRCSEINRQGPALLDTLPPPEPLGPKAFRERMEGAARILDVRRYDAFAGQHIPGAWNIATAGNLPTFVGWLLPPEEELLLVAEDADQAEEAIRWSRRVGMDRIHSYLDGGMGAWANAGLGTAGLSVLSAPDLHARMAGGEGLVLLDVRTDREFEEEHIDGAVHIHGPELRTRHGELDPERPTAVMCSTGNRSGTAASMLLSYGWRTVYNVAGGMTGYAAAGYSKACHVCVGPHGPGGRID